MKYNPEIHHRRSNRLKGWDYRNAGAYFVTICTHERRLIFGEVVGDEMRTNELGRAVTDESLQSGELRAEIELDTFVVMPNHLHGIVWICPSSVGTQGLASPLPVGRPSPFAVLPRSLSSMIRGFKSAAKIRVNAIRGTPGVPVWQGRFHDRIIRNDRELTAIRQYILDNPRR